jgi:hypothetical protein
VGLGRVDREVRLSIPKMSGSNPSELTFRSDLLLTARGSSTVSLFWQVSLWKVPTFRQQLGNEWV